MTGRVWCVDPNGLEPLLQYGVVYFVRPLACNAVEVRTEHGWFVVAASRFLPIGVGE